MDPATLLEKTPGIGTIFAKRLARLELLTLEDLINHYPFRYDDFSKISQISQAQTGQKLTFVADVWDIKNTYTRFRKVLTQAILNDGSGSLNAVWFNQPWLTKNIKVGDKLQISGQVEKKAYKLTSVAPEWEIVKPTGNNFIHTGRLVPIYAETYGLRSKWLRQKIADLLPKILPQTQDLLPEEIKGEMLGFAQSLQYIHFPADYHQVKLAKDRLSFDELFFIQLATLKKRLDWQTKKVVKPLKIDSRKIEDFINNLPFELTKAQRRVIAEIMTDLKQNKPMNRLVQGDVGSGKTVVAAVIIYLLHLNNLRSILMAPTEILAFQHHNTLSKMLEPYGLKIGLYTASKKFTKTSGKNKSVEIPDVVVGTHALLSKNFNLDNVGLIVVDEQQRFGVEQRSNLRLSAKLPHFLTMTATPIPRTVALTLYGDLDLSVIDELPKGRQVISTHFVPQNKRQAAYNFIAEHIKSGEQVYVITPLIEESETNLSAKAAKKEFENLKTKVFPEFRLGLLHGKLKSAEKAKVLEEFKNQQIDILVSTSVVEVGVDVPNATIMVIEGSERFGLAQLHQLRGRVGRGDRKSFALLFAQDENSNVIYHLKNLEKIHDGLKLSELDLKIRGSGEIFGERQSGAWNLKIASLSDLALVEKTRLAAQKILSLSPNLDKYPLLERKLSKFGQDIMPD